MFGYNHSGMLHYSVVKSIAVLAISNNIKTKHLEMNDFARIANHLIFLS